MQLTNSRFTVGLAITLTLMLAAVLFRILTVRAEAAEVIPPSTQSTESAVQPVFAARQDEYTRQIAQLDQLLTDRRSIYTAQVEELKSRVKTRQSQLEQLQDQERALQQQVDELAGIQSSQLGTYQQQLLAAQAQYDSRMAELSARLSEAQAKLAEVNTLLNR